MKIDVEGAELQLLNGGKNLISAHKPAIFLSVHSDELRAQCSDFRAKACGYSLQPLERGDFLAKAAGSRRGGRPRPPSGQERST